MASTNDIILQQYDSNGNWIEKTATPSFELEVMGLDSSLNPTFKTMGISDISGLASQLSGKQPLLESGTNIKTINGSSLLGSGDIKVGGGSSSYTFSTGTSLTIDCSTIETFHTVTISSSGTFTLSNMEIGKVYEFLVKNSNSSTITVSLPTTNSVRPVSSIAIQNSYARSFSVVYDGTKQYWEISEMKIGA